MTHVCLDKPLPQSDLLIASELAIEENPENAPTGTIEAAKKMGINSATSFEIFGAVLTGKKWRAGRTLRVRHLDGDPAIHRKVEKYAKEWEQYANVILQVAAAGEAEIRISYHLDGNSWSVIGTDALTVAEPHETMHYGWLDKSTREDEVRRVVLHEFGHALGMIHEQSQPLNPIKWDKPAVYRHYEQLGWSKEKVDFNVFEQYSKEVTQFGAYDETSIMHYPVDAEFTTDRKAVGWNMVLSQTDKEFITQQYPKPVDLSAALPAGIASAPPQAAAMSAAPVETAPKAPSSTRLRYDWS